VPATIMAGTFLAVSLDQSACGLQSWVKKYPWLPFVGIEIFPIFGF